jgi:hypothetical protein
MPGYRGKSCLFTCGRKPAYARPPTQRADQRQSTFRANSSNLSPTGVAEHDEFDEKLPLPVCNRGLNVGCHGC